MRCFYTPCSSSSSYALEILILFMSDAIQLIKLPHFFHMEMLCVKLFPGVKEKRGNYF